MTSSSDFQLVDCVFQYLIGRSNNVVHLIIRQIDCIIGSSHTQIERRQNQNAKIKNQDNSSHFDFSSWVNAVLAMGHQHHRDGYGWIRQHHHQVISSSGTDSRYIIPPQFLTPHLQNASKRSLRIPISILYNFR